MPVYKLTYFNGRGRAEVFRLMFANAGIQYDDKRLSQEEWKELKPNTPYGYLPLMEVDGKVLCGSGPIARLIGETHGMGGSNAIENAELAGIADFVSDLGTKIGEAVFEKDETRKATMIKDLTENAVPRFFGILEKKIDANGSGWVFGSHVTYVDFLIHQTIGFHNLVDPKAIESYPKLKKLVEDVNALPNVAEWIKKRPETPF